MLYQAEESHENMESHPLAVRMAIIAFINMNLTLACIWGTFSVLLGPVEARLHVGRELSTLAIPAVNLAAAICAPIVGALAARYSLRLIMLLGASCSVAGFLLLASSRSFPLYLASYGLLIGPGMAIGLVMPNTLVTRWFAVNRGKALGLISMPLMIAVMPLVSTWTLQKYGVPSTYLTLAAISVIAVVANLFVIDMPPGYETSAKITPVAVSGINMADLLRTPRFWVLLFAFIASSTGSIVLNAHMVPLARSWGLSATFGAALLATMALVGIAGTLFYGWVADRLGGALSMAVVVLIPSLLWITLLSHPAFPVAVVLVGVIGLNGSGILPVYSYALSEAFGPEGFSRAYGLSNLLNLPFSVLCVPVASLIFTRTGSYDLAIIAVAGFMGMTGLVALTARRRRGQAPTALANSNQK